MHLAMFPEIFRSISSSDIFYVPTSEMKHYLLKIKRLQDINIQIHPNGVDTNEFYPYDNQSELKERFSCENILLFVGNLDVNYGLQHLISVLPTILKDYKDTHLIVIGDGPYKSALINFVKQQNLMERVHILGLKPHEVIPYYINNSDVGIGLLSYQPMLRYTVPVKCLEYLACKKTFITSPCSSDLIRNNDVGILLKRDFTNKDLLTNLISLIEDKTLRNNLAEEGFRKVNENFTWEQLMRKFNESLTEIV
jgi:phosphatidylinositol alpha-1,6-mannosyltransferase